MAKKKQESGYDKILRRISQLRIPMLTLDRRWYALFDGKKPKDIQKTEAELNEIIKSQGRIREEKQKLNALKQRLMQQIISNMNAPEDSVGFKKMEKSRELINEINDKLVLLENDELDIPVKMREKNAQLALETMEVFYEEIEDELLELEELEQWIRETREEMKRKIALYEKKSEETKHITDYFEELLGSDITQMYVNYMNGVEEDDDEIDEEYE